MAWVVSRSRVRSDFLVKLASMVHRSRGISLSKFTGFRNIQWISQIVETWFICDYMPQRNIRENKTAACSSSRESFYYQIEKYSVIFNVRWKNVWSFAFQDSTSINLHCFIIPLLKFNYFGKKCFKRIVHTNMYLML